MAHTESATAEAVETAVTEAATYIGSMARELREIAVKHDLGFLAYLLAMAVDEAGAVAAGPGRHEASDAA